jgi:hypothetical protein
MTPMHQSLFCTILASTRNVESASDHLPLVGHDLDQEY